MFSPRENSMDKRRQGLPKQTVKFKAMMQGITKFSCPSLPRYSEGKGSKNMGHNT